MIKIVNIGRKSSYLLNDLGNFKEFFRKDVTHDNIKSHKKAGLQRLSKRYIFVKNTRGRVTLIPSPRTLRVKLGARKFQLPKYKKFFQTGFFFSSSESCLLKYKKNMKLESSISVNKRILFKSKLRSFIS